MHHSLKTFLFSALFGILLTACGKEPATPEPSDTYFTLSMGEQSVEVQLALTPNEQRKGLMFRREMGENQGMLFIFDHTKQMSFWMKNTYIPLDVGYIAADGTLREVHKLYPHDTTPVKSRNSDILMALEMNQGWFEANNIKAGDRLDMAILKKACAKRGFPDLLP